MARELPLKILGWVSPILRWVEGAESVSLPRHWRQAEKHLSDNRQREQEWFRREIPTASLDTLQRIFGVTREGKRGPVWNPYPNTQATLIPPGDYQLTQALDELTRHYFVWVGNELCIRKNKMLEIHALAKRFPVSHLIRFAYAQNINGWNLTFEDCLSRPMRVIHMPSNYHGMRVLLEKGLYEGHIHLSSMLGPEEIWLEDVLPDPQRCSRMTQEERRLSVLGRLLVSLVATILIFIERPSESLRKNKKQPIMSALEGTKQLGSLIHRMTKLFDQMFFSRDPQGFYGSVGAFEDTLSQASKLLYEFWWQENLSWLFALVQTQLPTLTDREAVINKDINEKDRIIEKFHLYLFRILIRCGACRQRGERLLYETTFRYIVINTFHWQQATQKGKTTGLAYFVQSRRTGHRNQAAQSKDLMKLALDYNCRSKSLVGIEGRIKPPKNFESLRDWLSALSHFHEKDMLKHFGLVIHFTKKQRKKMVKGHPFLRFDEARRANDKDARRLYRMMTHRNSLVPYIIGIDAAGEELAAPPEVFAAAFRFLREHPIEMSTKSVSLFNSVPEALETHYRGRRLGMSYHVGEDFCDPISGLRAIDEVLTFLNPQPGDRLGHALALGLDPMKWMEQCGYQAIIKKQELLDNLVWLYNLLGTGNQLMGRFGLERRIQSLSKEIYADTNKDERNQRPDWPIPTLYDAWLLRQLDPFQLDHAKLYEGKLEPAPPKGWGRARMRWQDVQIKIINDLRAQVGSRDAMKLLYKYWFDDQAYKKGQKGQAIDLYDEREQWCKIIREVQEIIQEKLLNEQMIIETCPTSNLLIGPIARMKDHQIYDLTLDEDHRLKHKLRVTVNTDNPGVVVTSLEHEYHLLAEVLLREGVPEAKVMNWINWLRKNSRDCSFLKSAPDPKFLKPGRENKFSVGHLRAEKDSGNIWQQWTDTYLSRRESHASSHFPRE